MHNQYSHFNFIMASLPRFFKLLKLKKPNENTTKDAPAPGYGTEKNDKSTGKRSAETCSKLMAGTSTLHIYYAITDSVYIVDATGKEVVMIAQKTLNQEPPSRYRAIKRRNALTEDELKVDFAMIRDSILSSTLKMYGLT